MASPTAHAPERSKMEQIVLEFFAKSLHIILESRIPFLCCGGDESLGSSASSSSSGLKTRDRWFNLALGDCTSALENFEPWRRSFSDPMVVDILLVQPKAVDGNMQPSVVAAAGHWSRESSPLEFSTEGSSSRGEGTVLERWVVQFERRKANSVSSGLSSKEAASFKAGMAPDLKRAGNANMGLGEEPEMRSNSKGAGSGSGIPGSRTFRDTEGGEGTLRGGTVLPAYVKEVPAVYKRTVIMLRSLYSKCRLLPAYRLFRLASTSSHCCSFSLTYRVLSSALPLSEDEERDMLMYRFTPVETVYGRMRLSVASRPTTAVTALEVVPPILPRIIPDYVGSPTTDPLKRFPGEPNSIPASGISRARGVHMVSVPSSGQNSPPFSSLGRRHSWSGGVEPMQPTLQPPSSPSYGICRSLSPSYPFDSNPSPPYPPSPFSPYSRKNPSSDYSFSPLSSPLTSADRFSGVQQTNLYRQIGVSQPINIENRQSPPFSSSPSPSPPTSYSQDRTGKGSACSGSAPVSIPKPSHLRGPKYSPGDLQHSRNLLPPPSPRTRRTETSHRSSSESPKDWGQLLSHTQRSTSFESPLHLQMLHADYGQQTTQVWTNERLYTAEILYRGNSQPILRRASSKAALIDDADEGDTSFPFVVDDDEAEGKQSSRTSSFKVTAKVSESSSSSVQKVSQQRSQDAAAGALYMMLRSAPPLRQSPNPPALTVDALEELQVYKNMRDFILSHSHDVAAGPTGSRNTDTLEELQLYKNMRDLILNQSHDVAAGPSGSRNTTASGGNR